MFPEVGMIPSTSLIPERAVRGHESQQQFAHTPPDGGNNHYQSALQWADTCGQEAEMSVTSSATAKPTKIESEIQQEVSVLLPRRGSCSILMALAIVKRPGCFQLGGRV